jgi:hypothetical protein
MKIKTIVLTEKDLESCSTFEEFKNKIFDSVLNERASELDEYADSIVGNLMKEPVIVQMCFDDLIGTKEDVIDKSAKSFSFIYGTVMNILNSDRYDGFTKDERIESVNKVLKNYLLLDEKLGYHLELVKNE